MAQVRGAMGLFRQRQQGSVELLLTDEESLRLKSRKVGMNDDYIQDLIQQMQETALDWEAGHEGETAVAIAAMQIGHLYKLICVRSDPHNKTPDWQVYINPKIVKTEGEPVEMMEGCLSVPGFYANVTRPSKIRVRANNLQGQFIKFKCDGLLARILQHECDHFHGKLFTDYVDRKDWIHASELVKKADT